jgi:hypothetical protein
MLFSQRNVYTLCPLISKSVWSINLWSGFRESLYFVYCFVCFVALSTLLGWLRSDRALFGCIDKALYFLEVCILTEHLVAMIKSILSIDEQIGQLSYMVELVPAGLDDRLVYFVLYLINNHPNELLTYFLWYGMLNTAYKDLSVKLIEPVLYKVWVESWVIRKRSPIVLLQFK